MSVTGLCQICESRTVVEQCDNCGTLACEQHYERRLGLCVDCAATTQPGRDRDGTDIHRFR